MTSRLLPTMFLVATLAVTHPSRAQSLRIGITIVERCDLPTPTAAASKGDRTAATTSTITAACTHGSPYQLSFGERPASTPLPGDAQVRVSPATAAGVRTASYVF